MHLFESLNSIWAMPHPLVFLEDKDADRSSVCSSSKSIKKTKKKIGPLIFNPLPNSIIELFSSACFSPQLPPPYPSTTLTRFLQIATKDSSMLPSVSYSIVNRFDGDSFFDHDDVGCTSSASYLSHNLLQLLCLPVPHSALAFFPTGDNFDQVGFLVLYIDKGSLVARGPGGNKVFLAGKKSHHRIFKLLVNPIGEDGFSSSDSGDSCFSNIGYLLACTMYSVNWYCVKFRRTGLPLEKSVRVDLVGSKSFKCKVVHACWSPHLLDESMVLLENGDLFLFTLGEFSNSKSIDSNMKFSGTKVKVAWHEQEVVEAGQWLSCEFSWHPRVVIVAHSAAVFLVDMRLNCSVNCLLDVDKVIGGLTEKHENDKFVAFSRASSDGFYFAVASNSLLLLYDVRNPLMPVVKWAHGLGSPSYMIVFKLRDLRSNPKDDAYGWANDSGYCIVLGSFDNCEFNLFCYGPITKEIVPAEVSKSILAWGLPSEISLSGRDCNCGNSLLIEEFTKVASTDWVDWRQKKEIILGFGILDGDLSIDLSEQDSYGGFYLIRIVSSGKLEAQRYCSSWEPLKISCDALNQPMQFKDSLLYADYEDKTFGCKRKRYYSLNYLKGLLKNNLGQILNEQMGKLDDDPLENHRSPIDFHKHCKELKSYGFFRFKSLSSYQDVFEDISLPTSIHEIVLKRVWASFPRTLLRLAFSTYIDLFDSLTKNENLILEFFGLPERPHLPPFYFREPSSRSNRWSRKMPPHCALIGPVVPVQFVITLDQLHKGGGDESSPDIELENECKKAIQVAQEAVALSVDSGLHADPAISLATDTEDTVYSSREGKKFSFHEPVAFADEIPKKDGSTQESFSCKNTKFTTLITKHRQKSPFIAETVDGVNLFDNLCPIDISFHECEINFGQAELKAYKKLIRQQSEFLEGYKHYQDYLSKAGFS